MGTCGMIDTSVCKPSHAMVSHNTRVAVYVCHMQLQMVSIQVCHVYANTNNSDERVASASPACRGRVATAPRSPESPPLGKPDQGYQMPVESAASSAG